MPLEGLSRLLSWFVPLVLLAVIILPQALRILREHERGVIFRLGELLTAKRPGPIFSHSDRRSNGANGFARRDHNAEGDFRLPKNGAGRCDDEQGADRVATAVPANHARNFQRA
jgi:hypothetical protein